MGQGKCHGPIRPNEHQTNPSFCVPLTPRVARKQPLPWPVPSAGVVTARTQEVGSVGKTPKESRGRGGGAYVRHLGSQ